LTGNTDASSGEIELNSQRLNPETFLLKRQIGYLPQNMPLPKWVTGFELLTYASLLYEIEKPKERVAYAMKLWDCASYGSKALASCSFGMQKRIGLALATLHDPKFLILDEPFSGLDLFHIHTLEQALSRRQAEGKTTILSTHLLSFVVRSCSRVFIMNEGRVSEMSSWIEKSLEERTASIEQHFFQGSEKTWNLPSNT
jgi:ABC-type multidrug transport system ATPase subunit